MIRMTVNSRSKCSVAVLAVTLLAACTDETKDTAVQVETSLTETIQTLPSPSEAIHNSGGVFVHLFEWRWPDVAAECELFLGPNGYTAVQVSPAQEHITGPQWWTRYQPVSYKLGSRGGTRAEFSDMVKRCKTAGVDIYADALINHMADVGDGTGVAGSVYGEYDYPVPYGYDDFHHCGRNHDDSIDNYQDLWEVQTCSLGKLPDLDTGKPAVQAKIAAYLNDLLRLGVAGFRLDAAKHVSHEEVGDILSLLDSRPFLFQEVIDRGSEPINARSYIGNGHVTEFKYPMALFEAFNNHRLDALVDLGSHAGFLPADKAVVFVDNHDLQRGHAGGDEILNYKDGDLYTLANVFMLAWPYGYPKVMSSYRFDDTDQGPPKSRPVIADNCGSGWVCEHRWQAMAGMVRFRKATAGHAVTNWRAFSDELISFGRGNKGHIIINMSAEPINGTFVTRMKPGNYCNVISDRTNEEDCKESLVQVGVDGVVQLSVAPMSAVAIHTDD